VSLSAVSAVSVMIFSNHTLPHSEPIVWTSVNQISALSESLSYFHFLACFVQLAHLCPLGNGWYGSSRVALRMVSIATFFAL